MRNDELLLAHAGHYLEERVVVSDKGAIEAMMSFAQKAGQCVELASAALVPAVLASASRLADDAVMGLVVCGGNLSLQDMRQWAAHAGVS